MALPLEYNSEIQADIAPLVQADKNLELWLLFMEDTDARRDREC